jgi:ubiquinone/menaquinone biosynthesis C-methylase UbiE
MYNYPMRPETLSIMCNPYTGERFDLKNNRLVDVKTGQTFPIRNGIPIILANKSLAGRNRFFRWLYDVIAFAYDPIITLGDALKVNTEGIVRREYISNLNINPGDKVLETAVGTASNILLLPEEGDYYGLDISWRMLKIAQKKISSVHRKAELFQGDGAFLPFRDDTFDLTLHMGGLQFYSDPYKGVSEMARVAKPGKTIHILDEIRRISRTILRKRGIKIPLPIKNQASSLGSLLVPKNMIEVNTKTLPGGDYFSLSFKKPN